MGRSGGDQDALASEWARPLWAHHPHGGLGNLGRLRHAADTGFACLGHLAGAGADQRNAVAYQLGNVAAGGGIVPHQRVHGRGQQDRAIGGEQDRGREIVGVPVCHLCHQIGGRRGDDDEIAVAREADVPCVEFAGRIEQVGIGAGIGQGAGAERRDELLRSMGHDAAHNKAAFLEAADQVERLVRSNAAADDEGDIL